MQLFYILKDSFSSLSPFEHFGDFLITKDIKHREFQLVVKHWASFQSTDPELR